MADTVHIAPSCLAGSILTPPSKSIAHRILISASLSEGTTFIENLPDNDDISATIRCLSELGTMISQRQTVATIKGGCQNRTERSMLCGESGSTLRFLLPLTLDGIPTRFSGSFRLFKRPLWVYQAICQDNGFLWKQESDSLMVCGQLKSGIYSMPGNISSQFVTGMLFSLPRLPGDSHIVLETPPESASYIDLTLDALKSFGISVYRENEQVFSIPGRQTYRSPECISVPGDASSASFFGALSFLGCQVTVEGLESNSLQGDAVWADYFQALCQGYTCLSFENCPDLVPICMVMAALKHGGELINTRRLQYKESDRGHAMAQELSRAGAKVIVEDNRIIVEKRILHSPTSCFSGHNDHRIVMALAILATQIGGCIENASSVSKSMPTFWSLLASLGASIQTV